MLKVYIYIWQADTNTGYAITTNLVVSYIQKALIAKWKTEYGREKHMGRFKIFLRVYLWWGFPSGTGQTSRTRRICNWYRMITHLSHVLNIIKYFLVSTTRLVFHIIQRPNFALYLDLHLLIHDLSMWWL